MPWFTRFVTRTLESLNRRLARAEPEHLRTARRGETAAYLYLRQMGYRVVAANLRVRQSRGEIDLIGWDDGILCFIEVKTRTTEGLTPPEAAVDHEKKKNILAVARRYVRKLPGNRTPRCRFDIVSVLLGDGKEDPAILLHRGAFDWEADRHRQPDRLYGFHSASWGKRR